jgi:UDP-galactopyranose mutase
MDYLVVGAGLFGSVFARTVADLGHKCRVIDKKPHIGGNCYTKEIEGIIVHEYGPHLYHTNNKKLWDYVNQFAEFNTYKHKVKATYQGKIYSLPFNMQTYYELWGCETPDQAKRELSSRKVPIKDPQNLEEWALSQVGEEIYHKLIYGYTKKQWMREPKELPAFIIKRLPLRLTFNDEYYNNHRYQGVPIKGFTHMIENILDHPNIKVDLNVDFFDKLDKCWQRYDHKLVYSGPIDRFFNYEYGELEYRTLRFRSKILDGDFQGIGQMNYTDETVPYTRIIEHKHFTSQENPRTVITYEYPIEWKSGAAPYLPINDDRNNAIYAKYKQESKKLDNVIIGGRLGSYRYFDMHQVIAQAMSKANDETP